MYLASAGFLNMLTFRSLEPVIKPTVAQWIVGGVVTFGQRVGGSSLVLALLVLPFYGFFLVIMLNSKFYNSKINHCK